MNSCIPSSRLPNRHSRPWLTKSLLQLIRKKRNLFDRAKHCARLRPRYCRLRNCVTSSLKKAKQSFFNNINPSSKDYWKVIKNLNNNTNTVPTLMQDQTRAESDTSKAELLSTQFCKNFNTVDPPLSAHIPEKPAYCPTELLISEETVLELLLAVDSSKATGPDLISGIMLKRTAHAITPIVTCLFNMSIRNCTFPDCWKTSLVSPIPKSGNLSNPANYRPISLLSVISKIFERHIFNIIDEIVHISGVFHQANLPLALFYRPCLTGRSIWIRDMK